jgi:hypothetical protein
VLLNRQAEVVRTNRAADKLLGGEVGIANKRLTAMDPAATAALGRALHRLLWSRQGVAVHTNLSQIALARKEHWRFSRELRDVVAGHPLPAPPLHGDLGQDRHRDFFRCDGAEIETGRGLDAVDDRSVDTFRD